MSEDRRQVMSALDQLREHSPAWAALIRAYILKLERASRKAKP